MKIGIGISDITPSLGIELVGYYYPRKAEGIHDRLHAKTFFVDDGKTRAALISCDICFFEEKTVRAVKRRLSRNSPVPFENIILCATHTHTGPVVTPEYEPVLISGVIDSLHKAADDASPKGLGYHTFRLPGLFFNRRYFMKDGSVVTNPGKCNPDIVGPAGPPADEIDFLQIDAGGNGTWTLVNVPGHPDTVAGNLISADYPFFIEEELKKRASSLVGTIYTTGTSGDINHWDVTDPSPQRGFREARRIGRVIAAGVVSAFDRVKIIANPSVSVARKKIKLPCLKVTAREIEKARKVLKKPYPKGVDFTLEVVEARKVLRAAELKKGFLETEIAVIGLGEVCLVGMPAEIFVELGAEIKRNSPYKLTIINDLSFASVGYIARREAYHHRSYELVSNIFGPAAGEAIFDTTSILFKSSLGKKGIR